MVAITDKMKYMVEIQLNLFFHKAFYSSYLLGYAMILCLSHRYDYSQQVKGELLLA